MKRERRERALGIANRVVLKNKKPGRLTPPPSPPFFLSSRSPPPQKKILSSKQLPHRRRPARAPQDPHAGPGQREGLHWRVAGAGEDGKGGGGRGLLQGEKKSFSLSSFPRVFWFFFFPSLCFLSLPSHFHSRELNNHHQNRETGQTASGSSPTPRLSSSSTSSSPARSVTL